MSPSEEVGDEIGFFRASHGSAPDIAGKGLANPYGTILASILMLRRLDRRYRDSRLRLGADRIEAAVRTGLEDAALRTRDIGGSATTGQVVDALLKLL